MNEGNFVQSVYADQDYQPRRLAGDALQRKSFDNAKAVSLITTLVNRLHLTLVIMIRY